MDRSGKKLKRPGKVIKFGAIDGMKGVHATLAHLVRNLEKDYPGAKQVVVIIQSHPGEDGMVNYGMESNHLSLSEKLWLLEWGKRAVCSE